MAAEQATLFDGITGEAPAPRRARPPKRTPAAAADLHPSGDDDRAEAAPCGHTELTLGCECGQAVAAWWAETKRRLAESSPSLAFLLEGPG